MLLSVIIVNYKTPKLLSDCIHSLLFHTQNIDLEIIVVDNDSKDESENLIRKQFPTVKYLQMGYNSGFSRANNAGIKIATGEYLLLLNSDTIIFDDAIVQTLQFFQTHQNSRKLGLVSCRLLNADQSLQPNAAFHFPSLKRVLQANAVYIWANRILGLKMDLQFDRFQPISDTQKVAWLSGAFLLCQTKTLKDNDLYLDEDFFMYSEDVELCKRFTQKGFENWYFHTKAIIHLGSASSTDFKVGKIKQVLASEWLYIRKTKGRMSLGIYFLIFGLNYILDELFALKNEFLGKPNDKYATQFRRLSWKLLKEIGFKRLFLSQKTFLKVM